MSAAGDEKKEYTRACQNIYDELVDCLVLTACVRNGGGLKDCLKDMNAAAECQALRQAYFECRKAQVRVYVFQARHICFLDFILFFVLMA